MSEEPTFPVSCAAASRIIASRLGWERPPHRHTVRGWVIRWLVSPTECYRSPRRVLIMRVGIEKILDRLERMEPTRGE